MNLFVFMGKSVQIVNIGTKKIVNNNTKKFALTKRLTVVDAIRWFPEKTWIITLRAVLPFKFSVVNAKWFILSNLNILLILVFSIYSNRLINHLIHSTNYRKNWIGKSNKIKILFCLNRIFKKYYKIKKDLAIQTMMNMMILKQFFQLYIKKSQLIIRLYWKILTINDIFCLFIYSFSFLS